MMGFGTIKSWLAMVALIIAMFSPPVARADADTNAARAIQETILRQIAAFQADDAHAAFALAAPNIQTRFGSSATFVEMVRRDYRAIYRPAYVEFAELVPFGKESGRYVQHVIVEGQDGRVMMAAYAMQQDETGRWRIAGCEMAPMKREST